MLLDSLSDIDWILDHLNKIKARNSVGEMAQSKFKRMLTRELSQFSETSRSGNQVAEWVSSTYLGNLSAIFPMLSLDLVRPKDNPDIIRP